MDWWTTASTMTMSKAKEHKIHPIQLLIKGRSCQSSYVVPGIVNPVVKLLYFVQIVIYWETDVYTML